MVLLSIVTARKIRRLMMTKANLIELDARHVILALEAIRDDYITEKGLAAYLSEMLAGSSTAEASACCLHWKDGRQQRPASDEEIQKYIKTRLARDLPYKVVTRVNDGETEKYL